MGKVLFDSQPIVVDRKLSCIIGLNETIVLQQVHYWLENNKEKAQNFYDGRYWTFNSIEDWQRDNFPFWATKTVARLFTSLESAGLLITGNYNKDRRDRTKWYSIDYDRLDAIVEEWTEQKDKKSKCIRTDGDNCIRTKSPNALGQIDLMQEDKKSSPLPESSSEITTENSSEKEEEDDSIQVDNILNAYKTYIEPPNTYVKENLPPWLKSLSEKEIIFAIKQTSKHSGESYAYLEKVLLDYHMKKIKGGD